MNANPNLIDASPLVLVALLATLLPLFTLGLAGLSGYLFARGRRAWSAGVGAVAFLLWALPVAFSLFMWLGLPPFGPSLPR